MDTVDLRNISYIWDFILEELPGEYQQKSFRFRQTLDINLKTTVRNPNIYYLTHPPLCFFRVYFNGLKTLKFHSSCNQFFLDAKGRVENG